ncbi:iron ABC transporter permease [Vreelandella sulfidaeris]|uniref:Iron ABC transporter permease n=1 Tax=Vreelandella sulfidaeris TaxID=115553 RepID=A0A365TIK8_9GAMM|nr:iron ABC transporter permease [Halomonas sulfidaeris]RBI65409.1 iron ABC transporter permease [Halomonas sulfidaeris]
MTQSSTFTYESDANNESNRLLRSLWLLSLLLAASAFLSLCLGSFPTQPLQVLSALTAPAHCDIAFIIWQLRLPRIVLAILVGAALAMAGAILQSIVRNPLASPDVVGITSGAALAAVLYLTLLSTSLSTLLSIHWLPTAAMLGALVSALLVTSLAWKNGISPSRVVLVGIGLAAAMGAGTTLLIVISEDSAAMTAYVWLTGSLYAAQWGDVMGLLPWLLAATSVALAFSRHADAMALGDQVAEGLGVPILRSRMILLGCSVALAGAAVAFAGGLSFVGLIAPHLAAKLVGRNLARLVPVSALVGALIVVNADLLGRVAFLPKDLPAGIFVAGIGAPFFVYLLHRSRGRV